MFTAWKQEVWTFRTPSPTFFPCCGVSCEGAIGKLCKAVIHASFIMVEEVSHDDDDDDDDDDDALSCAHFVAELPERLCGGHLSAA